MYTHLQYIGVTHAYFSNIQITLRVTPSVRRDVCTVRQHLRGYFSSSGVYACFWAPLYVVAMRCRVLVESWPCFNNSSPCFAYMPAMF